MKQRLVATTAVIFLHLATKSSAENSFEYADVIASVPIYQVVKVSRPQEQCWEEEIAVDRYSRRHQSNTPVLVSTIIGGAIGNAVGHKKSTKRVGAVLGALLGRSIGRDIVHNRDRPDYAEYETAQRCDTVYQRREEERLVGYQVTYLYNGEEYSTRTDFDPGDQIRIQVSVQSVP